jgi:hypothetical protein
MCRAVAYWLNQMLKLISAKIKISLFNIFVNVPKLYVARCVHGGDCYRKITILISTSDPYKDLKFEQCDDVFKTWCSRHLFEAMYLFFSLALRMRLLKKNTLVVLIIAERPCGCCWRTRNTHHTRARMGAADANRFPLRPRFVLHWYICLGADVIRNTELHAYLPRSWTLSPETICISQQRIAQSHQCMHST